MVDKSRKSALRPSPEVLWDMQRLWITCGYPVDNYPMACFLATWGASRPGVTGQTGQFDLDFGDPEDLHQARRSRLKNVAPDLV